MLVLPKTQKATVSQGCGTPTKPQRKVYPIDLLEVDLPALLGLNRLVCQLREMLQGQGLLSEDIDIDAVKQAMEEYTSNELEWQHMALHDALRGYSRNGVVNINGNANMLLLVWSPGKLSAIHDHANAHCCMKILKGSLMELLYDVPDHEGQMVAKKHTELTRDQVGYISDDIGLHKISNPTDDYAVLLHVYTPPYALINGCSMYESNGRKHHVDMSKYYSWQGQLVNLTGHSTC